MAIAVIIAGLPGRMATAVYAAIQQSLHYEVAEIALVSTAEAAKRERHNAFPEGISLLVSPTNREGAGISKVIAQLGQYHEVVAVDFSCPEAVNDNAQFYCTHHIPFIMGTTGGNRALLKATIERSDICAVVAPNMSIPIVMLMDMFAYAAERYPGMLDRFSAHITESHQAGKRDVSGTALAIAEKFHQLGVRVDRSDIISIRDPAGHTKLSVPTEHREGHAWHTYALADEGGGCTLQLTHNVNGRQTYIDGTMRALDFLADRMHTGVRGKCFSMTDVMQG